MKQTPIGWCSHHLGSVKKSFQFDNEQQMENFCLGLLAQTHKKISKVIAIEDHAKHNIEVEIISPTEQLVIASQVEQEYKDSTKVGDVNENKTIWKRLFFS